MILTKEKQLEICDKYVKEGHDDTELSAFIDGINAAIELINKGLNNDE